MENWKDIKGYEGLYQVSDEGRVKSLPKVVAVPLGHKRFGTKRTEEKILSGKNVTLYKDGVRTTYRVYRLVAEAFVENPNGHRMIKHKDGDSDAAENLEWVASVQGDPEKRRKNKRKREIERAKKVRPDEDCTDVTLWDTYMGEKHGAWYVEYARECIPEPEMRIKMWKIFDSL